MNRSLPLSGDTLRVADYISNRIYELGVRHVFMITGGGAMFLNDGIASHPGLEAVCNHHEQACAMGAVAYAKYKNDLGVVMTTTGCGSTNVMTGLLDAWQDNVPCLFISGQVNKSQTSRGIGLPLRQVGVQEADIVEMVRPITKYAVMVPDANSISYHFEKAIHLAKSGRPGPVWLDIPMDIQGAFVDPAKLETFTPEDTETQRSVEALDLDDAARLQQMFATAERPVVLVGNGIRLADAIPEFLEFVERYGIPFVNTYLGVDLAPSDHPLNIGRIGIKGDRAGNFAVQNSDLVLAVGTRLGVPVVGYRKETFAREAKIAVVDIDVEEHKKPTVRVDHLIQADAKEFFRGITLGNSKPEEWIKRCQDWRDRWPVCQPDYDSDDDGINIYYFINRLSRLSGEDSVMIADAGSAYFAMSQSLKLRGAQRYIIPSAQAELGFTIPAAIGVSFARDKGEAIGVTGDGSFSTNIQELQTIVHHRLPVRLFILNNDGYLSNRAHQRRYFEDRFIGTDTASGVSLPDYGKIATAYGIAHLRVSKIADLDETIRSALTHDGPVVCEIICPKWQDIVPTLGAQKTADGKIVARPAEDMAPFLDRDEFFEEMIVTPLEESKD